MNPLHHGIRTLEDYAYWVDKTIGQRGGDLAGGYLAIDDVFDDEGERVGDLYDRQRILFVHGYEVEFAQFVDVNLDVLEYFYIYRRTRGPLVVELHKHPGHEQQVGGLCHMHVHDEQGRTLRPSDEYDFDEALDYFLGLGVPAHPS